LISIPSVIDRQSIKSDADSIGIVFPCYLAQLYGIPLIIERFLNKLENIGSKYLFAVCSFGGYTFVNGLPTLKNLARLVKSLGGRLSGEFATRLPMNNLDYGHIPVPINKNHDTIFKNSKQKIVDICKRISNKKKTKYRIIKSMINLLLTPMYLSMKKHIVEGLRENAKEPKDSNLSFRELIPLTDKSISTDDKCNGCAICVKVCPVHNIQMKEQKPIWLHHCEMCFACDEWCPTHAIHHWSRAEGIKYHHPAVKLADIFEQNQSI
jgi:formate hydrogenlyase subunit 6/NADH:ubiquinone oxidoreductase subunit I